jgi:hypothetical protein
VTVSVVRVEAEAEAEAAKGKKVSKLCLERERVGRGWTGPEHSSSDSTCEGVEVWRVDSIEELGEWVQVIEQERE